MHREREGSGFGPRAKAAPEELLLLDEGDLESPAQLPAAPMPPVADLPMPAEVGRRMVSLVSLPRDSHETMQVPY